MIKQLKVNPIRLVIMLLIVYFVIVPLMVPAMIYYPIKQNTQPYTKVKDFYITTSDNVKINAWYAKAKKGKPTVIFCHGNGGNIIYYEYIVDLLSSNGYGVMLFDYRGYGKSFGHPDEKGLYKDMDAVINYLVANEKIPKDEIILWGLSLGGALVSEAASKDNYKAVILQSTFTNIKDEAVAHIDSSHPRDFLLRDFMKVLAQNLIYYQTYDTYSRITKIKSPILIACAKPDPIISYKLSLKLAKLMPNAQIYVSEIGDHNTHSWFDDEALKFITAVSKKSNAKQLKKY